MIQYVIQIVVLRFQRGISVHLRIIHISHGLTSQISLQCLAFTSVLYQRYMVLDYQSAAIELQVNIHHQKDSCNRPWIKYLLSYKTLFQVIRYQMIYQFAFHFFSEYFGWGTDHGHS